MADTKLVDVELKRVVLRAAVARLSLVCEAERQEHGVARTTLADVARTALTKWRPGGVPASPVRRHGRVPDATIRAWAVQHGYPDAGAEDFKVTKPLRTAYQEAHAAEVTALRFGMPRDSYDSIKAQIHDHNQSVAGVIQTALERFARTGKY